MIVTKNREALCDMMDMLRKFIKERRLMLNTEKTKVVAFNKSRKKRKK